MSFSLKERKDKGSAEPFPGAERAISEPDSSTEKEKKKEKPKWFSKKQPKEEPEGRVSVSGKRIRAEETVERKKSKLSPAVVNVLSPMGIKIEQNHLYLGENKAAVLGVVNYPEEVSYGWLKPVTNIPATAVGMHYQEINAGELIRNLNSTIRQHESLSEERKNYSEKEAAARIAENAKRLIRQLQNKEEKVGLFSTVIMPFAPEEAAFKRAADEVKTRAQIAGLSIRGLSFFQKQAFLQLSPFQEEEKEIGEYLNRVIPLSAFIGGFPFASSGFNDGSGSYIAKDLSGGLVIADIWKKGADRTNSNLLFLGGSGAGKSTAVKHILISELMKGANIFIIDPESEYAEFTKNLGGDVIDTGGGREGKINPLQIRPLPKILKEEELKGEPEEEREDDKEILPDLAAYLNMLETFFGIYASLSEKELAALKMTLIELYARFGIDWDTDIRERKNEDFPVMKDLYDLLTEKKAAEKEAMLRDSYETLSLLLRDIAVGADAFVWNGPTTMHHEAKLVCFDTSNIQSFSKKKKAAQYFNITSYLWQMIVANHQKGERSILVCDEAYLMIDPDVPQGIAFLSSTSRRIRKYEGSLVIISHLAEDFLAEKVKQYAQPLLDLPSYKFLMGTDGKNLEEIKGLYKLKEAEERILEKKKQKEAVAIIGSKRIPITFEIPAYKFEYFGSGGGR